MAIDLNGLTNIQPIRTNQGQPSPASSQPEKSFGSLLKNALNEVSRQENESDKKAELLAQGKIDNLHDVMLTAEKANITVETAVQIQQKVIDTYNEMMRMQI